MITLDALVDKAVEAQRQAAVDGYHLPYAEALTEAWDMHAARCACGSLSSSDESVPDRVVNGYFSACTCHPCWAEMNA